MEGWNTIVSFWDGQFSRGKKLVYQRVDLPFKSSMLFLSPPGFGPISAGLLGEWIPIESRGATCDFPLHTALYYEWLKGCGNHELLVYNIDVSV